MRIFFLFICCLLGSNLSAAPASYKIADFMKEWNANSALFENQNKGKEFQITAIVESVRKAFTSDRKGQFWVKISEEQDEYGPTLSVAHAFFTNKSEVLSLKKGNTATFQCILFGAGPDGSPFFENCKTLRAK